MELKLGLESGRYINKSFSLLNCIQIEEMCINMNTDELKRTKKNETRMLKYI